MLIAELCQNHKGDLYILEQMVKEASKAGAWACKIQTFFADDLSEYFYHDYDRIKQLELDWIAHKKFVEMCKEYNVEPMTSVYDGKYADRLKECGFTWVKIGSADSIHRELIDEYIYRGFKVIISTGGRKLKEIPHIWPLNAVLHCVSKYPHSPYESNLLRMMEIKFKWHRSSFGFSDHTDPTHLDWALPSKLAMFLGASYIEKHFTILPRDATKDGPVSISPPQLQELCEFEKLPKNEKAKIVDKKGSLLCLKYTHLSEQFDLIKRYSRRWKTDY